MSCISCFRTNKITPNPENKQKASDKTSINSSRYVYEATTEYKCPILKLFMQNPIQTNCPGKCVFDRYVFSVIRKENQCPLCKNIFTKITLLDELNEEIQSYLKDHPSHDDGDEYIKHLFSSEEEIM